MSTFERGQHPVGVTTEQWPAGDDLLMVERWYPAAGEFRGRDLLGQDGLYAVPPSPNRLGFMRTRAMATGRAHARV